MNQGAKRKLHVIESSRIIETANQIEKQQVTAKIATCPAAQPNEDEQKRAPAPKKTLLKSFIAGRNCH
jgi:hypothetical protein